MARSRVTPKNFPPPAPLSFFLLIKKNDENLQKTGQVCSKYHFLEETAGSWLQILHLEEAATLQSGRHGSEARGSRFAAAGAAAGNLA